MQRLAFLFFAVAVVISMAFIIATGQELPARVATHFGLYGNADSYMPRDKYLLVFGLIAGLVPVGVVLITVIGTRLRPGFGCKRHRAFWSLPENRNSYITFCTTRTMLSSGILALFLAAMHYMVLRANELQPPRLPSPAFATVLGAFVVVFVLVAIMFRLQMDRMVHAGRRVDV